MKIINEQNRYVKLNILGKTLLLPNGSLGYWFKSRGGRVFFREVEELCNLVNRLAQGNRSYKRYLKYDHYEISKKLKELVYEIKGLFKEGDSYISPSYAITVHKAQGSDFNCVIFILPKVSNFTTKELVYTALTRAKKKLYLLLSMNLKDNVVPILQQVKALSELDRRQTLLFKYRKFSGKIYSLKLRDGKILHVRSKVEYMIAKTLDSLGIEFEYEPRSLEEHGVVPDFKLMVDGKVFYIEHLGLLDKEVYRRRWEVKKRVYERLGVIDQVITTSEPKEGNINVEETIKKIIDDMKRGKLAETKSQSPSKHHYILINRVNARPH